MDLELTDTRAMVMGSSSGIGKAVAAGLAREGARVVVIGRDAERLQATADEVGAAGWVAGDVNRDGGPEAVTTQAIDRLGGLDILVTNTTGGRPGGLLELTPEDEDEGYRQMLRSVLRVARTALPALREGDDGRMVFLAARSILEASPELALSSVFRSGVAAAARSLALELAPRVRVNVVVLGQIDTPALARFQRATAERLGVPEAEVRAKHLASIPLGRFGAAEDVADAVLFLCSSRAGYITGSVLRVDGGSVIGFH